MRLAKRGVGALLLSVTVGGLAACGTQSGASDGVATESAFVATTDGPPPAEALVGAYVGTACDCTPVSAQEDFEASELVVEGIVDGVVPGRTHGDLDDAKDGFPLSQSSLIWLEVTGVHKGDVKVGDRVAIESPPDPERLIPVLGSGTKTLAFLTPSVPSGTKDGWTIEDPPGLAPAVILWTPSSIWGLSFESAEGKVVQPLDHLVLDPEVTLQGYLAQATAG